MFKAMAPVAGMAASFHSGFVWCGFNLGKEVLQGGC